MFPLFLGAITGIIIGYILWGKGYDAIYREGYEDAKKTYNDYNKGFTNGYECAGDIIIKTASDWCKSKKNDIINNDKEKEKEQKDGKEG